MSIIIQQQVIHQVTLKRILSIVWWWQKTFQGVEEWVGMITYSGLNICFISAFMKFHLNDSQRGKKTSWTHKDGNGKRDATKILSTNVWKLEREWMSGNQPQGRESWIKKEQDETDLTSQTVEGLHEKQLHCQIHSTRVCLSHPDAKLKAVLKPFPCLAPGIVRLVPFIAPLTPRSRRLVGSFQG